MLKPQKFLIVWEDGSEETVTVDGRDYMFYERESGKSSLDLISEGNSMTTWYILAAAGMRRQGRFEGLPEEFYEKVVYVLPQRGETEEAESPDPTTQPAD